MAYFVNDPQVLRRRATQNSPQVGIIGSFDPEKRYFVIFLTIRARFDGNQQILGLFEAPGHREAVIFDRAVSLIPSLDMR